MFCCMTDSLCCRRGRFNICKSGLSSRASTTLIQSLLWSWFGDRTLKSVLEGGWKRLRLAPWEPDTTLTPSVRPIWTSPHRLLGFWCLKSNTRQCLPVILPNTWRLMSAWKTQTEGQQFRVCLCFPRWLVQTNRSAAWTKIWIREDMSDGDTIERDTVPKTTQRKIH